MSAKKLLIGALWAVVAWLPCHAQPDLLPKLNEAYQAGELKQARELADEAIKDPGSAASPEVWLLRGFVYKDLYKTTGKPGADVLRDEAMASLYTCTKLDKDRKYTANSKAAYWFLARTIYNDAVNALNKLEPAPAVTYYGKYTEALQRMAPDTSLQGSRIDFGNALGTVYVKLFVEDREDLQWYNKAVDTYRAVLAMDSNNYGANYNLATLFYNRGVFNIQRITPENDIPSLQQIQEVSREYFAEALPYMMKAHRMRPQRAETILGLEGIHYSLQDEEKSQYYRNLFQELRHDEMKEKNR